MARVRAADGSSPANPPPPRGERRAGERGGGGEVRLVLDPDVPALRADAEELHIKPGQMFQPIRVAVCGRKAAPPLFQTLEVIGQQGTLTRIDEAIKFLEREDDEPPKD